MQNRTHEARDDVSLRGEAQQGRRICCGKVYGDKGAEMIKEFVEAWDERK